MKAEEVLLNTLTEKSQAPSWSRTHDIWILRHLLECYALTAAQQKNSYVHFSKIVLEALQNYFIPSKLFLAEIHLEACA